MPIGSATQPCVPRGLGDPWTWGGSQHWDHKQRLGGRHRRTHRHVRPRDCLCEPRRFQAPVTAKVLLPGAMKKGQAMKRRLARQSQVLDCDKVQEQNQQEA